MNLDRYASMDPHLLFGLVNTELRNHSESLEDLCKTHGLEKDQLLERLRDVGYEYLPEINQFR